jgi:hypothetical protein
MHLLAWREMPVDMRGSARHDMALIVNASHHSGRGASAGQQKRWTQKFSCTGLQSCQHRLREAPGIPVKRRTKNAQNITDNSLVT